MYYLVDDVCIKEVEEYKEEISYSPTFEEFKQTTPNRTEEDYNFFINLLQDIQDSARKERCNVKYEIFCKEKSIGYVILHNYSTPTPEVEISINEDYQSKGIGYKAMQYVMACVFERKDVWYLVYRLRVENQKSLNLVKKCNGIEVKNDKSLGIIKEFYIYNK